MFMLQSLTYEVGCWGLRERCVSMWTRFREWKTKQAEENKEIEEMEPGTFSLENLHLSFS